MANIPKIAPIKVQEFEVKQSKYEMVGKLPTRAIVCAPSGGGKTVLLSNLILDIYRNCFSRIYIFSPSIDIDYTWTPVKKHIANDMKALESEDEQFYFNEYDPDALENIIETQHKVTNYMKKHNYKTLYQILIVIDDFADDPSFTRQSKLLHHLYVRGRHNSISTITSTQKYNVIAPIVRINATQLYVFRLRNFKDLEAIVEELSAVADKKTLLEIYHTAREQPYSFLFVNLVAHNKQDMFHIKFSQKISIE